MLILGAALGGGLLVVRRSLRPLPFCHRLAKYGVTSTRARASAWLRAVEEVQRRSRLEDADLVICAIGGRDVASRRLLGALVGMVVPLGLWLSMSVVGGSPSALLAIPAAMCAAALGFHLPAMRVRKDARTRRRRFRTSLSAYLDLVAIMLSGGAGIETALHAAARVGDGPTFDAVSEALELARTTRRSPWDALAETGQRFGVEELPELAATVQLGGEHGARMTASLIAKASSMRSREFADVEARANEATERMGLPMVLLFVGFLVLLGYPAMHLITSGFE